MYCTSKYFVGTVFIGYPLRSSTVQSFDRLKLYFIFLITTIYVKLVNAERIHVTNQRCLLRERGTASPRYTTPNKRCCPRFSINELFVFWYFSPFPA